MLLLCLLLLPLSLAAQVATRAGKLEAARSQKVRHLAPDEPSTLERTLVEIKDRKILERITAGIAGFRAKFGGLVNGSGFALGPEYLRRDLADGKVVFRTSARASFKAYQLYDMELDLPRLAGDRLFLNLYTVHRNYPGVNYYGPGPDSNKTGRSDFRLEDTSYEASGGVRLLNRLHLGLTGGYLQVNVGPGADKRFVSTEKIYSPVTTPGIDRQTNFLRGGGFVQYDYRDLPGGPRKGGRYLAAFTYYSDRELNLFSFRRLHLEAQQYLPFFNERRVIALRAKSVFSDANHGRSVPFYLQPVLGGSDDLRGFRPFRFYDNNMMVFNAEYRWETFSGLDTALFVDAGKVFPRREQWNFDDLETSDGVGLRFNVHNAVFMRIDFGFSHEGFQTWLKFSNVF